MRSTRYAIFLAAGYALLSAVYIFLSTALAAHRSANVAELESIELIKGMLFVAVTALAVFAGARLALARIERSASEISARERALLANERRVLAGLLAASTAHDANNVLVGVLGDLDELTGELGRSDERLSRLQRSIAQLITLNRRLLNAARQSHSGVTVEIDLAVAVKEALETVAAHPLVRNCQVRLEASGTFTLLTHPVLVQQIVSNLVVNAAEATHGRGRVDVRLARRPNGVALEVHDNGPGVPPERRAQIFDALETSKPDGSGLGLFSVKSCATALGGKVEVDDSTLGGACFRVTIPLPTPLPAGA